jgi:hypothetical protein
LTSVASGVLNLSIAPFSPAPISARRTATAGVALLIADAVSTLFPILVSESEMMATLFFSGSITFCRCLSSACSFQLAFSSPEKVETMFIITVFARRIPETEKKVLERRGCRKDRSQV